MSTNRIEGAAKAVTGSVKEAVGKAVGNDRLQVEGANVEDLRRGRAGARTHTHGHGHAHTA